MQFNFNILINELKIHTMSFLDKASLAKCGRVNKELNKLSSCDFLWKAIFEAEVATYENVSSFNSTNYKSFVTDNSLRILKPGIYNCNKILKQIEDDIKIIKNDTNIKIKFLFPDYNKLYLSKPEISIYFIPKKRLDCSYVQKYIEAKENTNLDEVIEHTVSGMLGNLNPSYKPNLDYLGKRVYSTTFFSSNDNFKVHIVTVNSLHAIIDCPVEIGDNQSNLELNIVSLAAQHLHKLNDKSSKCLIQ